MSDVNENLQLLIFGSMPLLLAIGILLGGLAEDAAKKDPKAGWPTLVWTIMVVVGITGFVLVMCGLVIGFAQGISA